MKCSRNNDNLPYHGSNEVVFDARGKAMAVAEGLEDQCKPNEIVDSSRSRYKQEAKDANLS